MTSSTRSLLWPQSAARPVPDSARQLVVVTDIDGSLLEPGTRSLGDERAALDFLAANGVPLVINSSRTRAEIERLHQTLGMQAPFISEHGSALFVPDGVFPFVPPRMRPTVGGGVIEFGRRYHDVVEPLRASSRDVDVEIVGFSDLTIEEAARELGVPIVEAQLAKLREYSELFRIVDEDDASRFRLIKSLRRRGLRCWRVGAHQLVTGTPDRTESLTTLKGMWTQAWGKPVVIGFADSEDDVAWLRHVDVAVFVEHGPTGVPARVLSKLPTVHVARSRGRAGWSEAIFEFVGAIRHAAREPAKEWTS